MKIAIDVTPIRSDGSIGGAMNLLVELIKGFQTRKQHSFVLLTAEWNKQYFEQYCGENIKVLNVVGDNKISLLNRVAIKIRQKIIKKKKYKEGLLGANNIDLLFCPLSAPTYSEDKIPTISVINDIQHDFYPQFFTNEECNHRTNFYNDIANKVDHIICISEYTKNTFCEKYDYCTENTQTVHIAIQDRFNREINKECVRRLDLDKSEYIVYPANFWEHKNHKLLLLAFSMFINNPINKNKRLILTGNALDKNEYYMEVIEKLGIKNNIIITGYLKDDEIYSIFELSKGIIFPSLFEGFGIPVIEAMYLNKPVAASKLTSIPEVGGEAIEYFDPRNPDSILCGIEYLFNTEASEELINQYAQQLKKFDSNKMIDNYIDAFEKVSKQDQKQWRGNRVHGVYADNWSEQILNIKLVNQKGKKIRLQLWLPDFADKNTSIKVIVNQQMKKYIIHKGETLVLEQEIESDKVEIEATLARTWNPHKVLGNDDKRELGVLVKEITLISGNNSENLLNQSVL